MYIGSYGLGDTWATGKQCYAMPTEQAAFVLNNATPAELLALQAAAPDQDTKDAIIHRNPLALAWHLAGGDDCRTTSTKGAAFVALFQSTQHAIENRSGVVCDVDPLTGVYTCPQIDVTVPGGTPTQPPGGSDQEKRNRQLGLLLGGLGLVALFLTDTRRARRR